jgi:hypothetical protein
MALEDDEDSPPPPPPFVLTDEHARQYREQGYTVFEGIIPPPLLERLRTACAAARALARESNPQAQRLQPVERPDLEDYQPAFVEYAALAPLRDAVEQLLGAPPAFGDRRVFGVLLEPRDRPYALPIKPLSTERAMWTQCSRN